MFLLKRFLFCILFVASVHPACISVVFSGIDRTPEFYDEKEVAKIMHGEPASAIRIEEAERCALVFNLKRARELGIRIPDEILFTADELIGD